MNIKNITVVGAGAMGSGIAYIAATAGYNVTITDREQKFLDSGMEKIRKQIMDGIDRQKMTPAEGQKTVERLKLEINMPVAVQNADIVIEAIFEDMDVKKKVFAQLGQNTKPEVILASNTSMLSISEIASSVENNPERVLGLHFFNPPAAMKLVEVVLGERTGEQYVQAALELTQKLGKIPVKVKDSPGFIVNRVLVPVLNEAMKLLDENIASKEDIDKALTLGANFPVGPLTLADFVGLDIALASLNTLEREFGNAYKPSPGLVKLVSEGKLGTKTGEGFYKYQ